MSKTILKLFYMYSRVVEEISKCVDIIGHQSSHCGRRNMKIWSAGWQKCPVEKK